MFKSGFVALVGKPNAGKSSLVNSLVGFDVSIITPKPQTTRFNIKGIRTTSKSQIIFIDTPGVHTPKQKLGNYMMKGVEKATEAVDVVLYVVDGSHPVLDEANSNIIKAVFKASKKVILAINKVDAIKKENILRIIEEYVNFARSLGYNFLDIIPISVVKKDGLDTLINIIEDNLPEGDMIYSEEDVTDINEKDIVSEIIRKACLKFLDEEVPHGINILVDKFKEKVTENGNTVYNIEATLICKRDSHKGIIIGKGGEMLKRITQFSLKEMQQVLGVRCTLKLWVKVRPDWDNNENYLSNIKDKIR
jgi:GTP-binding protein Era